MDDQLPIKKRKKVDWPEIDKDIEEEIETQLKLKAKKTHLTKNNVKSILRHIIRNENVLTMVRNTMNPHLELSEDVNTKVEEDIEPKITRSKAKELLQNNTDTPWLLSPIKKTKSEERLLLIELELPEDDDDEEYEPNEEEEHSEDETGRTSVISVLSQTSTKTTNLQNQSFVSELASNDSLSINQLHVDEVGSFMTDEENICHRTRSKLCLSDTPLETIEQAFIPPDITTDMYDFDCDNEDWTNFLKEFTQPLLNNNVEDEDDEIDPEYNVLADEEVVDSEELRGDSAVKVSRRELRNLMAEVFECPDEVSSDEEKERRVKDEIVEHIEPNNDDYDGETEIDDDINEECNVKMGMTNTQIMLLKQQSRQHVQLSTQHFLQTYRHPLFSQHAADAKNLLVTLYELSRFKETGSCFNIFNLEAAVKLTNDWQDIVDSEDTGEEILKHMENEVYLAKKAKKKRNFHRVQFHPKLIDLIINSKVFIYPLLLPPHGFRCDNPITVDFCTSEDQLIALGLEQFREYLKENPRWFDRKKNTEKAAIELTCEYLLPVKKPEKVARHIRHVKDLENNPINYYRKHRRAQPTLHHIISFSPESAVPPCKQIPDLLPQPWKKYVYPYLEEYEKENEIDNR